MISTPASVASTAMGHGGWMSFALAFGWLTLSAPRNGLELSVGAASTQRSWRVWSLSFRGARLAECPASGTGVFNSLRLVSAYDRLLTSIKSRSEEIGERPLVLHWPHVGSAFRGLVIVGQAIYGWPDDFRATQFQTSVGRAEAIRVARAPNAERPDPLDWIASHPVRNSPFWTTARLLADKLEPEVEAPWYGRIAWVNLCPAAPESLRIEVDPGTANGLAVGRARVRVGLDHDQHPLVDVVTHGSILPLAGAALVLRREGGTRLTIKATTRHAHDGDSATAGGFPLLRLDSRIHRESLPPRGPGSDG